MHLLAWPNMALIMKMGKSDRSLRSLKNTRCLPVCAIYHCKCCLTWALQYLVIAANFWPEYDIIYKKESYRKVTSSQGSNYSLHKPNNPGNARLPTSLVRHKQCPSSTPIISYLWIHCFKTKGCNKSKFDYGECWQGRKVSVVSDVGINWCFVFFVSLQCKCVPSHCSLRGWWSWGSWLSRGMGSKYASIPQLHSWCT